MHASDEPIADAPTVFAASGRVPQVGEHVHAAPLDLRGLRVLVLVDHVLVDRQVHQLRGPAAPPTSGRTSPGSGARCRRASARRRRPGRRSSGAISIVGEPVLRQRLGEATTTNTESVIASRMESRSCSGTVRSCNDNRGPTSPAWDELGAARDAVADQLGVDPPERVMREELRPAMISGGCGTPYPHPGGRAGAIRRRTGQWEVTRWSAHACVGPFLQLHGAARARS